eukprot:TRINITY_DN5016_c0_g2_i1.p1 TRINITY_DN5016_c0_g2~~TRINITY_DN5016_c0_g2_i1.p1  ORF type:complete len:685 (+),score=318.08 TRINITY_DN5016_c0_g2_i1:49-2103(+)
MKRGPADPAYPPFKWPATAEEVAGLIQQVEADTHAALDAAAALPDGELSFAALIKPLMHLPCFKTNPLVCQAKHLQHCSTDPAIREAAGKATSAFAALKKLSQTRRDVYAKVKAYAATAEAQALPAYDAHYVQALLKKFERGGLSLSDADAAELKSLLQADADVCSEYGKNLAEDKTTLSFTPQELDGCDEAWVREKTNADGAVVLTLKYPDVLPVLQNCAVAATRRAVTLARETAYGNNLDLVAAGVQLRKKAAALLGYPSWAHYVTSDRMAGSPERVQEFLGGILEKAQGGALQDKERLRRLKAAHLKERGELEGDEAAVTLDAWDTSFYNSLLLKREYGVDHEAIRKYFPCPVVVEGTLRIYQDLLGLTFTELQDFDTWHPEVRLFLVEDAATQEKVGHFYLDLHPREGKYGHAAIFHVLKRAERADGTVQIPADCMLANLPPPSADGTPALLRHDDVVTFFHEFGHIMHSLCAEGSGNSTTLAKCPRDFVEAPSQMLENWCFCEPVLKVLSSHVDTKEPLPTAQIAALLKAKNVSEGLFMLRQLYLSLLDLEIHGADVSALQDAAGLQALVDALRPKVSLMPNPGPHNGVGCNMLRNFGHLMNQYSAAYYGYLWAEVLSADMFATRFEADPFSVSDGMDYRKQVLAVGGVGHIADHLEAFLGRPPTQEPFLRSRGILKGA